MSSAEKVCRKKQTTCTQMGWPRAQASEGWWTWLRKKERVLQGWKMGWVWKRDLFTGRPRVVGLKRSLLYRLMIGVQTQDSCCSNALPGFTSSHSTDLHLEKSLSSCTTLYFLRYTQFTLYTPSSFSSHKVHTPGLFLETFALSLRIHFLLILLSIILCGMRVKCAAFLWR